MSGNNWCIRAGAQNLGLFEELSFLRCTIACLCLCSDKRGRFWWLERNRYIIYFFLTTVFNRDGHSVYWRPWKGSAWHWNGPRHCWTYNQTRHSLHEGRCGSLNCLQNYVDSEYCRIDHPLATEITHGWETGTWPIFWATTHFNFKWFSRTLDLQDETWQTRKYYILRI